MCNISTLDSVDDGLRNIFNVIPYPLKCLADKNQFKRGWNSSRILHHEGQ